ncbi:MAG: NADP-dependent malic enzyme [Gammaproteobacteria bacterium]|nr:NADP-dependent malic enzyme [Gammaproteobacteria bacterium]MBI5617657.1 NADP-dependent malic enzyme [Gammaproteobacteria bacterium]
MDEQLVKHALEYHRVPRPGKVEIAATKPLATQRDLALAYSPGVAAPCEEIAADPLKVADYTNRANLVAVITNGTAVLGLGDIGPLAGKPVMEGKAVLFKKFSGIDVFDIEIAEKDPDKLVEIIASLAPTFGGINLEDIKAPECFYVEEKLRERCGIPVFHDDQHGTAIIASAAILNALKLVGKRMDEVRLVVSGAGAAALACLSLLETLGLTRGNVTAVDRAGVIYRGRPHHMEEHKAVYAQDTTARTLAEAIVGADVFLGLSGPGVLTGAMVATMAAQPIILALANPTPEILPEEALAARPDAIVATGRSDYPNQVNNVLCFPYMFRGALDAGATTITQQMKAACVRALAELTMQEASDVVLAAYGGESLSFGREYIIPKPFDPRLITTLAPAIAKAAMESGVATRPIADLDAYREQLTRFVFQSMLLMRPIFDRARTDRKRLVYADGEEPVVLRAVQSVVDDRLARPILVGRPAVIAQRIAQLGLRLTPDEDFTVVNPESDHRFREYSASYHALMSRRGVTLQQARTMLRTNATVIAALLLQKGEADAMLCGVSGAYHDHLRHLTEVLGVDTGHLAPATYSVLVMKKGTYFMCDTQVHANPSAAQIADTAIHTADRVQRFGLTPRLALLSHSNFGTSNEDSALRMREALALIRARRPGLEVDGEMQADAALLPALREAALPDSTLSGAANVLVMPGLDAANIAMHLLTVLGDGVVVGPILMGLRQTAHVLTPSASVRRVINMSALAVVDAQIAQTAREPGAVSV